MASAPADPSALSNTPPPLQPPLTTPFRFKITRPTARSSSSPSRPRSASPTRSHRHHHHRHHHRSKRRPRTPPDDPTLYDDTYLPNPRSSQYINPDIAFRESLFDALADDEGAAYWEGVYGQPIHTYSPYTTHKDAGYDDDMEDPDNPRLERMDDEAYVSYVRGKMWEKSHGYIVEERRRREEARRKKGEKERAREEEGRKWQAGVEAALRRGEERKKRKRWRGVWEGYLRGWEVVFSDQSKGKGKGSMRDRILWPVESGRWEEVGKEEVERFYRHAPQAARGKEDGQVELGELLKKERVRWHPDKMQQKAGSEGLDEDTTKIVTAVFQMVDRLWSETKGRA